MKNNQFKFLYIGSQIKTNEALNNIYLVISNALLSIQVMLNKSNIFGIKKLFDKTNTNMILLKNQIIKIKQSNEKEHLFNKKLLSRYFANYMIL
mgnify:CR=1 FL=1